MAPTSAIRRRSASSGDAVAKGERGATLVLALVFLLVVGLVATALSAWVGNDLRLNSTLVNAEALRSTANSAIELAMQDQRYSFTSQNTNFSSPQACWGSSGTSTYTSVNNQSVDVWCSTLWVPAASDPNFSASYTRTLFVAACPSVSVTSGAACMANPLLLAEIGFNDYSAGSQIIAAVACSTTCGSGAQIQSWTFNATPPTVASVSCTSTCGQSVNVNVTGSGFVSGSTSVYLLSTTGVTYLLASATNVTSSSPTALTATLPASYNGPYKLLVVTPYGASNQVVVP